jgi:hypothetical protein
MNVFTHGSASLRGSVGFGRLKLPHHGTKAQSRHRLAASAAMFAGEDQIPPPPPMTTSGENVRRAARGRFGT